MGKELGSREVDGPQHSAADGGGGGEGGIGDAGAEGEIEVGYERVPGQGLFEVVGAEGLEGGAVVGLDGVEGFADEGE